MTVSISGTNGVTFPDNSLQTAAASPFGLKNRLINADMRIDQRNAGASVTPTASAYVLDRYRATMSQASKYSVQQSSTAPSGFVNSLLVTSASAYSLSSTDAFTVEQYVEGLNIADLGWGTASAQTVTLSFWVRSSLTGTFGGALKNSAQDRCYPYSYTINSANTWEQKTVTIAGDTTGTWLTTNGIGIRVGFNLGTGATYQATAGAWTGTSFISAPTGATSVVSTNGATFYITGVQLEIGTTATPFERRLYNQELANCQRYYEDITGRFIWSGNTNNGSPYYYAIPFLVQKRAVPTIVATNGDNSGFSATASSVAGTTTINATRLTRTANASVNGGYFADSITASSEL
jgi:ribosome biogenesis protein Tsr3